MNREKLIEFLREQVKLHNITLHKNDFEFADDILALLGVSESICECKVCGKPFDNNEDYYRHYDEEHN